MSELTDKEIKFAYANSNFGEQSETPEGRKDLITEALMKIATGYRTGHTIESIVIELHLARRSKYGIFHLTYHGVEFLAQHFPKVIK